MPSDDVPESVAMATPVTTSDVTLAELIHTNCIHYDDGAHISKAALANELG